MRIHRLMVSLLPYYCSHATWKQLVGMVTAEENKDSVSSEEVFIVAQKVCCNVVDYARAAMTTGGGVCRSLVHILSSLCSIFIFLFFFFCFVCWGIQVQTIQPPFLVSCSLLISRKPFSLHEAQVEVQLSLLTMFVMGGVVCSHTSNWIFTHFIGIEARGKLLLTLKSVSSLNFMETKNNTVFGLILF